MRGPLAQERSPRVAVIGAGQSTPTEYELARELGRALAQEGAIVLCGGLGGVMEGVARGVSEGGGVCIGLLPGPDAGSANRWVTIPLATDLGDARNVLVVAGAEAAVAVGGSWGTLSEIALARSRGLLVGMLGDPPAEGMRLKRHEDPAGAAAWAVREARSYRKARELPDGVV